MPSLILHPTTEAHWHDLVNEAQAHCDIHLAPDLEHYLVFLLIRFMAQPGMAGSVLGLELLHSYHQSSLQARQRQLKEVGDKCLLFAGLFPARATKRHVKLSYYVRLGQLAYSTLYAYLDNKETLFISLSKEFPKMMDVLHATRGTSGYAQDLLQSLELWHETGSPAAWHRLIKATHSLPVFTPNKKSH